MGQKTSQPKEAVESDEHLPPFSTDLHAPTEEVIEELDVSPEVGLNSQTKIAELLFKEGQRMMNSDANWQQVKIGTGFKLEKKVTTGALENTKLEVFRADMEVAAPSQEVFDSIITVEGFQILDPSSNPEDFGKPLHKFDYKTTCQIEKAVLEMPCFVKDRTFVVLNVIDQPAKEFLSRSVYFSGVPGSTKFFKDGAQSGENGDIRILILNFFQAIEAEKEGHSILRMVQILDFGGSFPDRMSNSINREYFVPLHERLQEKFGKI